MIKKYTDYNNLITRRGFLIALGKMGLMSGLVAKLYHMQMIKSQEYIVLSEKNHINLLMLPPVRGNIMDRSGEYLALNKKIFKVMLDKKETKNYTNSLEKLFQILHIEEEKTKAITQKVKKYGSKLPIILLEDITWEEVAKIEENIIYMPGVFIDVGYKRFYTQGAHASHILGYVGILTEQEQNEMNLYNVGEFNVGKLGIEKYYDQKLRGNFGTKKMEVNAYGLYIREKSVTPSSSGENITLTIDSELQKFLSKRLDTYGSTAIVMDIFNGDILSLASSPSYEANNFVGGISNLYWNELLNNPAKPLINRAINSVYPPGSIFKIIVALAALENNIGSNFTVFCEGHIYAGNRKFRCSHSHGHGKVNMQKAIISSCNIYFYTIVKIIGVEKILNLAAKFGYGELTGIDLHGESSGFLPSKKWKKRKTNQEWTLGDSLNTSIGQGYLLSTPIQMIRVAAAIANGGRIVKPKLLKSTNHIYSDTGIDKDHISLIQQAMIGVVNQPFGTAYSSKTEITGYTLAGKTGTSQIISKKNDEQNLSSSNIARNKRNHSIFIGYFPAEMPKYAISIVVENGGNGSFAAAPIAKEIAQFMHNK